MIRFFVFMEDFHLSFQSLMRLELLIENKRSLMKEQCVILCGLTRKKLSDGEVLLEVLVTYLGETLLRNGIG